MTESHGSNDRVSTRAVETLRTERKRIRPVDVHEHRTRQAGRQKWRGRNRRRTGPSQDQAGGCAFVSPAAISGYSRFFPLAFAFVQRSFAIADSLALASALMLRLRVGFTGDFCTLSFAQRALCAAAILFLAATLMLRFGATPSEPRPVAPSIRPSSTSSTEIFCLMLAARRNWAGESSVMFIFSIVRQNGPAQSRAGQPAAASRVP